MANFPLYNPGELSTHYDSGSSYAASGVIKTTPGRVAGFHGYNSNAAAQFIMIFDSATVPADTAKPIIMIKASGASTFSYDPGTVSKGKPCTAGISWSNSSTSPTKTIGAADCWISVSYD